MKDPGYAPSKEDAWIETSTGIAFYPFRPTAEMVSIVDIAWALSRTCRWNGHSEIQPKRFYSVAEHSVLMADYLRSRGHSRLTCLTALLHDGAEAYVSDVPGPIKPFFPGFKEMEALIDGAIAEKFGSLHPFPPPVKELDRAMIPTEHEQLFTDEWCDVFIAMEPVDIKLKCWSPEEAYDNFMGRYASLTK